MGKFWNLLKGLRLGKKTDSTEHIVNTTLEPKSDGEKHQVMNALDNNLQIKEPEQKKGKIDIKLRESYLRAIIENQPGLVWLKDTESRFLAVNSNFAKSCGLIHPDLLIGKTDFDIWPYDLAKKYCDDDAQVLKSNRSIICEELVNDEGTLKIFETFKTPVVNEFGEIIGTTGYARDITERKQTQERIKASEEKYRLLAENATDVIWIHDMETKKFIYVSPSVFKLRGFTVDEVMQQEINEVLTEKSYQYLASLLPKQIEEYQNGINNHFIAEIEQPCKDGSIVWTETIVKFQEDKVTGHLWMYGSARNITKRKIAEEALSYAKNRFQAMIENATDGIALLNHQGHFEYASPAAFKSFGYDNEDIIGHDGAEFTHPQDMPQVKETFGKLLAEPHKKQTLQYRFRKKNGEFRWIETVFSNLLANECIRGFVLNFSDITEKRLAEEKLQKSEAMFRNFVENANDIIYQVTPNGELTYVSPNWTEILGYPLDEVIGERVIKFIHPDDLNRCLDFLKLVLSSGEKLSGIEYRVKHKNGEWCWHVSNGSPLRNDQGAIYSYVGIARDVTERKMVEQEIVIAKQKAEESEIRLKQAQEVSKAGTYDWNIIDNTFYWSDEFLQIFGMPGETVPCFDAWKKVVHPDDIEIAVQRINKSIENQTELINEYRIILPTKEIRWIRATGKTFYENGIPHRMIGLCLDITENKKAENELKRAKEEAEENEKKLTVAQEIAKLGSWELDVEAGVFTFTDNFYKLFHTTVDEMGGYQMKIEDYAKQFVFPDDSELVALENQKTMETNDPLFSGYLEHRILYHDGGVGHISVKYFIIKDELGNTIKTYGVNQDISHKKIAEEELLKAKLKAEESEARYKHLVETASDAIYLMNEKGIIIDTNITASLMLQKSKEEIIGCPIDAIDPNYSLEAFLDFWGNIPFEEQRIFETTHINKKGDLIPAEVSGKKFKTGDGTFYFGVARDITERKKAEKAIIEAKEKAEESEERYNLTMKASSDGIYDWNLETNVIYYSPGWKKMLGYEEQELPNDFSVWEHLTDPEDVKNAWELHQKLITKQVDRFVMEFKMKHKAGHWVNVLVRAEALFNENGKAERVVGTHTDITERKLAQEKIKASEEKYRDLANSIPVGIFEAELNGRITFANATLQNWMGKTEQDFNPEIFAMDFVPPHQREMVMERLQKIINELKPQNQEYFLRIANGEMRSIYVTSVPLFKNGKIAGIRGTIMDISERKKAEEIIRRNEENLRNIADTMQETMSVIALDGTFLYANQKAARNMSGGKTNDIAGMNIKELVPLKQAEALIETYQSMYQSGNPFQQEIELNLNNTDIWFFNTLKPIEFGIPPQPSVLSVSLDITELKLAEKELIEAKEKAEESEANVRAIIEGTQDSIWAFNRNYEILYINKVFRDDFERTFGVTLEKGISLIDSLPKVLQLFWKPRYDKVLANEQFTIEDAVETENGPLYIQVTFNPIIKNGQVIGGSCFGSNITQRKLAEKELIEAKEKAEKSEERFTLAMKASSDGIYDWNLVTNEIYYSPGWKKMLGYGEEELLNDLSVWEKLTDPEDVKNAWELHQKLITKQVDRFVMEFKMKHKAGHWVDVLVRAEAFFSETGIAVRIVGTHTDITERKLAQEKIKASEKKYRDLANSISVGIFEADLNGRITFANATLQNWVGKTENDFIHEIFAFDFVPPHQRQMAMERTQKIINELMPLSNEYLLTLANGETLPIYVTSVPLFIEGRISGIRSTLMDISERKKAESIIHDLAEQMKFILAATTDGFFKLNSEGIIIESNYQLSNMLGYLPHELNQFPLRKLEAQEMSDDISNHMEKVIKKGSDLFETQYYTREGKQIEIEVSTNYWPEKKMFLAFVRDISKRKKAEQDLLDTKMRLQKAQTMVQVGNWELDLTENTIWASDEAFKIYGITKTSDENYLPYDLIKYSPLLEYRHSLDRSLLDLLGGKNSYDIQFQISRLNDMDIRFIHSKAELVKDADNKPVKVVGVIQDITEQKLLENELRILLNAVEQNPASIVISDTDGFIEYVNPKFTEITGYSFSEAKGQNPRFLKSGLTPESEYDDLWKTIKAGYIWSGEFCNKKKNGELFWESATISPVYNYFSKITHFVAVKEDITDKKHAKRQLLNASIEGQEQERNRFSRELHDGLGPLLSSIKLYFQWIAETDDPEKKKLFSAKGNTIINEAITAIREISNNLSPRSLKTFGLVPTLKDYLDGFMNQENLDIHFEANFDARYPMNIELALYRIVLELFNNSRKHAKATQIRIILNYNKPSAEMMLHYTDNGMGFDVEKALKMGKGHGILNINNRVTSVNGKISMQSPSQGGLSVRIEIPDVTEIIEKVH